MAESDAVDRLRAELLVLLEADALALITLKEAFDNVINGRLMATRKFREFMDAVDRERGVNAAR